MRRNGVRKYEHVNVAEMALGKELPAGACVHHVNEVQSDNRPENLVICQDGAYHRLLHSRMRALAACGNANWRRCWICREHDDPARLSRPERHPVHRECESVYRKNRYHAHGDVARVTPEI